jgi:hypothetical protein
MSQRLAEPRRQAFLIKMQTQSQTATDFELGVPQALTLLNGSELNRAVDAAQSGLLAALEAPFMTDRQRIEIAFLATLAREPRDTERSRFVDYVESASLDKHKEALGDVVWALVNSAEFALNH